MCSTLRKRTFFRVTLNLNLHTDTYQAPYLTGIS